MQTTLVYVWQFKIVTYVTTINLELIIEYERARWVMYTNTTTSLMAIY